MYNRVNRVFVRWLAQSVANNNARCRLSCEARRSKARQGKASQASALTGIHRGKEQGDLNPAPRYIYIFNIYIIYMYLHI